MLKGLVCRTLNSVPKKPLLTAYIQDVFLGNTPYRESISLAMAREAGKNFYSLLGSSSLM